MRYKLKGQYENNIIYTIFKNNKIDDIQKFLNPTDEDDTDVFKIKNIDKGIDLLSNAIDENKKIFLLVDSDVDGYTSSSIMYQYLKGANSNLDIKYYLHGNKMHGLTNEVMNYLNENEFDLVIIPDAGSSDLEQIKELKLGYNMDVLVIDHHQFDEESEYGVIINNQQDDTNKNLTGAGMAYLVCKALDKKYNTGIMDKLQDFAMIGLIGDGSDLKENEVRNICINRINKIENEFIKTLYEEKGKPISDLTFKDLSFGGVIPLINSFTRVADLDEKILMFEALNGINEDFTKVVTKKKLNKETRKYELIDFTFNLYQYVVNLGNELRNRQDREINKILKEIKKDYVPNDFGIYIYINDDEELTGINGLLANKIVSEIQKPTICCRLVDGKYKGSLRGCENVLSDFKGWCEDTGLFEMVSGHSNAAGVSFKEENLEKILELSKNISDSKIEKTHYVDNIYYGNANIDDLMLVGRYEKIFNNGLEEPIFAIEGLEIPKIDGQYTKNTMRFKKDDITYVKFFTKKDDYSEIFETGFNSTVKLNLIVKFKINKWNGKEIPQAEIIDFEVVESNTSIYGMFA